MSAPGRRAGLRVRHALAVLALALATLGASRSGRADEASAAEAFHAGSVAYSNGDYRTAALSFEAAFRERPHGAAMYNAAQSWLAAGVAPRAADAYAASLDAGGLDPAQEADARKHLKELDASLGLVTVEAPSGARVSVGYVEKAAAPLAVRLEPGKHSVHADLADGTSAVRSIEVTAGGRASVSFAAPEPAAPPTTRVPGPPPPPTWPIGWTLLGAGVVAGAAVVPLGLSALDARSAFEASGHTDRAAHDRAAELQAWTNVALVAAGTCVTIGVVLLVTSSARRPAAALQLSPRGVSLSGTF